MGEHAESRFVNVCKKKGVSVRPASQLENMFQHFDFIVSSADRRKCARVEVKSMKARRRGMEPDPRVLYVELKNVHGYAGWLFGKADYLAFEQEKGFLMVDRKELIGVVDTLRPHCTIAETSGITHTLYSRRNRKDLVMIMDMSDIKHLSRNMFWLDT